MAATTTTLSKIPCFLSLSTPHHNLFSNHQQRQCYLLCWKNPPPKRFRIFACSVRKSRGGRKVKSNVELCNDIREFVSAVGLPEGHVPSMKELSDHGRNDLANIVRRRGYKLIRDLLSNTNKADIDDSSADKSLAVGKVKIADDADKPTGQNAKVEDMIENSSLPTEVPFVNHSDGMDSDSEHDSIYHGCLLVESPVNLSSGEDALHYMQSQEEKVTSIAGDGSLSSPSYEVHPKDEKVKGMVEYNSLSTSTYNREQQDKDVLNLVEDPMESSAYSSLEEKSLDNLKCLGEKVDIMAEDVPLSARIENTEDHANDVDSIHPLSLDNHNHMLMDSMANSTLREKAAKFIQDGYLDDIEDNVTDILNESNAEERDGSNEPESMPSTQFQSSSDDNFEHIVTRSNAALTLNGSVLASKHVVPTVTLNCPPRNDNLSVSVNLDQDLDSKTRESENQVEINHLKFMLHQKELELSRLKEQIEKEKLALSALQTKAEAEINKAQKLISEKDAEILAAEESLSGLVEVKIQYSGHGEMVEVSGSFNDWHHRIKMDPHPSTIGSRKSRVWSTMLWLYPGVYEIKFIVDGHWRIDPQLESVSKGGISNNILRVDR